MSGAAIFDLDGTLVDTMPIHYEAYRLTFAEDGIALSEADFYDNIGGIAAEAIPKFLRGRASSKSTQELHERKKEIVAELLQTSSIPVLETAKLLPFLYGRVPMALASSGAKIGVDVIIDRCGFRKYFGAVITGDDVSHGKPSPEPFLLAAKKLGADPKTCLVFEDTDDGVAAAIAAGMDVIDVKGSRADRVAVFAEQSSFLVATIRSEPSKAK